jgi:GT2 family glycosyltransferase
MLGDPHHAQTVRLIAGQRPPLDGYDADIIILSLNRLAETTEAIQSALAQRGGAFHVTVLDQGSTVETVRGLTKAFSKAPNFALYRAPSNLGVAGGRNLATSLGHGRIIIALDNDAVFELPWVAARALRSFSRKPDLGALGFSVLSADGLHPDTFSWGYPACLLKRFRERFDTTTFVGAGHAIRRVTWDMVGGYDQTFFFTWEEYDFCLAAIALNWRVCYDGTLAVIHKVSPTARVPWNDARTRFFVRNRLIIGRKWGASWLSLTPRMLGYMIRAALDGRVEAAMSGIRAAREADPPCHRKMPKAMRKYLVLNETRHRGSWLGRLRTEVLGRVNVDPC